VTILGEVVSLPVTIDRHDVLHFLGYPDGRRPFGRIAGLLGDMIPEARRLARPRGVFELLPVERAAELGLDANDATRLVAGLVTIGDGIESRSTELLRAGAVTEALLLDAAGSAAVEEAADRLGALIAGESRGEPTDDRARASHLSCRISPGVREVADRGAARALRAASARRARSRAAADDAHGAAQVDLVRHVARRRRAPDRRALRLLAMRAGELQVQEKCLTATATGRRAEARGLRHEGATMTTTFRPRIEFLAPDDVERIVGEACRVLETTGILVENDDAARVLLDGGATKSGERIAIAERLVHDAIASAPSRVVLYDRDGNVSLDLGESRVHFDPGSAAINVLDRVTRRRREALTGDVVRLARLVDALPNYAAQSTALVASDVPADAGDRYRIYLALRHGRKPIITGTFRKDGFAPMAAMLSAVRGGSRKLAEKPLATFDCCVSPPLKWSDLTCQALVDCARAGIPAEVIPMPLTGATSPVTLRETIVQHCAENLSGLVIHQLAQPGAPFVFGGAPAAFDMRRGSTPMGAIETMMLGAGYAQVGRHLGIPTHGYFCVSDAKTADYQAGLESGVGAILGALSGVNMISGPGMLDYLLTQSLEKIVLDHEACGMALRAVRGVEAGGGDAMTLIADVVRLGEFLSHDHTRKNWRRELSQVGKVIDRESYGDWEGAGGRSADERAAEEVERILAKPAVTPLPEDVDAEITAIMRAEAAKFAMSELPKGA
jgi:trimethylamine--corrinoid protein Co-methyltransferase